MKFTKDVDLATESYTRDEKNEKKTGIITTIIDICGSDAIKTEIINEIGERNTGKEIGTYLTLPLGEIYKYNDEEKERIKKAVGESIRILINEHKTKQDSIEANITNNIIKETPQQRYKALVKEHPEIITQIPQHYIATYLGISPVSLSRIRGRKWFLYKCYRCHFTREFTFAAKR